MKAYTSNLLNLPVESMNSTGEDNINLLQQKSNYHRHTVVFL